MISVLPISSLRDEDSLLFGNLNVILAKLTSKFPIAKGIVVSPPELHLKTVLEHFDFKNHEVFEQSLSLYKKEIEKTPVPEILANLGAKKYFACDKEVTTVRELWLTLLNYWLDQVKQKIWLQGFDNLTGDLKPIVVIFTDKLESFGTAFCNEEVLVEIEKGELTPPQLNKLDKLIKEVSKKLLLPYKFKWILDKELKIVEILPYTETARIDNPGLEVQSQSWIGRQDEVKSTVKVFLDLSTGLVVENSDGIFIASEKIPDPEELIFKLVESGSLGRPVLFKLSDIAFNLIHQDSLFNALIEPLTFARNKKGLNNISLVIPFVRGVSEFMEIKRKLALKDLSRKSIEHWLEIAVPENILNIEDYLVAGVDGVILNLDELIGFINGFNPKEEELTHYKHEINGLIKFLGDSLKILHKSSTPFIASGSLALNSEMLDFLVSKGVYGIVVERYEAHSIKDLLHQTEKRLITA